MQSTTEVQCSAVGTKLQTLTCKPANVNLAMLHMKAEMQWQRCMQIKAANAKPQCCKDAKHSYRIVKAKSTMLQINLSTMQHCKHKPANMQCMAVRSQCTAEYLK